MRRVESEPTDVMPKAHRVRITMFCVMVGLTLLLWLLSGMSLVFVVAAGIMTFLLGVLVVTAILGSVFTGEWPWEIT